MKQISVGGTTYQMSVPSASRITWKGGDPGVVEELNAYAKFLLQNYHLSMGFPRGYVFGMTLNTFQAEMIEDDEETPAQEKGMKY